MAAGKAATAKKPEPQKQERRNVPAVQEPKGSSSVPAHLRKRAGQGTENLGAGDYEMPRLKLLQGLSEELQAYDGLRAGMFFHTMAEKPLGDKLTIVPLYISKRFVLWRPRPPIDQGGILARADDGVHWSPAQGSFTVKVEKGKSRTVTWELAPTVVESGLAEWGTYDPDDPNSQPAATLCYVYVVHLPEHPELSPVALFLQRTAVSAARKLAGKLKISGAPIYGCKFEMSSFLDERNGNKFNNYRFASTGFVEDEDECAQYEAMWKGFKSTGVNVKDLESAQEEEVTAGREEKY